MQHQFPGVTYNPYTCNQAAANSGFPYYGLQHGGECWATYNLTVAKSCGRSNSCNMTCVDQKRPFPGNCGGSLTNAIHTTCRPVTEKYKYQGCYVDGGTKTQRERAMEHQFLGTNYDRSSCYETAVASNFTVFALQFGGECWASNSLKNTTRFGNRTSCTMFCFNQQAPFPGNCGGALANAVHTIA